MVENLYPTSACFSISLKQSCLKKEQAHNQHFLSQSLYYETTLKDIIKKIAHLVILTFLS